MQQCVQCATRLAFAEDGFGQADAFGSIIVESNAGRILFSHGRRTRRNFFSERIARADFGKVSARAEKEDQAKICEVVLLNTRHRETAFGHQNDRRFLAHKLFGNFKRFLDGIDGTRKEHVFGKLTI